MNKCTPSFQNWIPEGYYTKNALGPQKRVLPVSGSMVSFGKERRLIRKQGSNQKTQSEKRVKMRQPQSARHVCRFVRMGRFIIVTRTSLVFLFDWEAPLNDEALGAQSLADLSEAEERT